MTINRVGVVGCGFMGAGITQVCAESGYQVLVTDIDDEALQKGLTIIERFLSRGVERRRATAEDKAATLARIKGVISINDLADCDIVIEAVPEILELKKEIFARLDNTCANHTILSSNTSAISITELARATGRPDRIIGTHFLSPVPPSKLLEIVRPPDTSDETLDTVKQFGKSLGKEIIIAKDTPGFIFNYMLGALTQAALELLENNIATAEDIDRSMTLGLGHPIGPIALSDFNGIDTIYLVLQAMYDRTKEPLHKPSSLLKKLLDEGRMGRKAGKGFYEYT